jgi:hypothetical protein
LRSSGSVGLQDLMRGLRIAAEDLGSSSQLLVSEFKIWIKYSCCKFHWW